MDTDQPSLPEVVATDEPPISDEELERWCEAYESSEHWVPKFDDYPTLAETFEADFDAERAEYLMARLVAVEAQIAESQAQAQAWASRIAEWVRAETKRPAAQAAYYRGALANMLRKLNEADPTVKSKRLPSGRITSKGPTPGNELAVEFEDQDAFVEWAREHRPDIVRTRYDALITSVREFVGIDIDGETGTPVMVTGDGETVTAPGLKVTRKERTFDVEPAL